MQRKLSVRIIASLMKDGEPCTLRGVSTVLEGVTPRPLTKESMAWRFLPYELYTNMRYSKRIK